MLTPLMLPIKQRVKVIECNGIGQLPEQVLHSAEPLVLKGLVSNWPLVKAAGQSRQAAMQYLRQFYQGATVGAFFGLPESRGRVFYNEDMSGFNFERVMLKLDEILLRVEQHADDPEPPMMYVGSTTVDNCLPGFRDENDVDFSLAGPSDTKAGDVKAGDAKTEDVKPLASIWLGNRARIAAHYDVPDNLACNVVGRRRFTLFPPSELPNLYAGPLDFTPAGQSISLVDFEQPDYEKHPRFKVALEQAQVAELEPGDAVFMPSMWWHHVQSLESFNVLINYWWRQSPAFMDTPLNVLNHALLAIRDLPQAQREAWHEVFNHYVFNFEERSVEHIDASRRGVLAPMDEMAARKLRAQLLSKLNR